MVLHGQTLGTSEDKHELGLNDDVEGVEILERFNEFRSSRC